MSGTVNGGKKAAQTNVRRYGEDFYKIIGGEGGRKGTTGGFASDKKGADGLTGRQRARVVGAKGGKVGKRGKATKVIKREEGYYDLDAEEQIDPWAR